MAARGKKFTLIGVVLSLCAATIGFATQHAYASFTAALTNTGNTFGSGTSFLTVKNNGTTLCGSVPAGTVVTGTASFTCAGSPIAATVSSTQVNVQTDLVASGTASFKSTGLSNLSCTPVAYANMKRSTAPLLVRGGVSWQTPGPSQLAGSLSTTLDGSDALGTGVYSATGPQTFSVGIWFKTSSAAGTLAAWSNGTAVSDVTATDRILYLDASGHLNWGTYANGANQIVTGTTNVADGAWHYALATATAATNSSISLYMDGNLVGSQAITGSNSAQANSGYWRIGNSASTSEGWTGNGTYFNGSLANFTVFGSALTAGNVSTLWGLTTESTYVSTAQTLGDTDLWKLDDPKTQTTTLLPSGAVNPCAHADVIFNGSTVPFTYAAGQTVAMTTPTTGNTTSVVIGVKRDPSYNTTFDPGIHLLLPFTLTMKPFTQTFTWLTTDTML